MLAGNSCRLVATHSWHVRGQQLDLDLDADAFRAAAIPECVTASPGMRLVAHPEDAAAVPKAFQLSQVQRTLAVKLPANVGTQAFNLRIVSRFAC